MEQPPRRVGKRLIGRFLLMRIGLGTLTLIVLTVSAVFWVKDLGYNPEEQHAQALNVLNFGAISMTMSARFARKSAFHCRTFHGNPLACWSYAIMTVLQVFITYTPGLNSTIFSQSGMDGLQWGIVALYMLVTCIVMETEKAVRNYLTYLKYDTDDVEYGMFDAPPEEQEKVVLPSEVHRFGRNELQK